MLGIHNNSWSYTVQWVSYCEKFNIAFVLINLLEDEISTLVTLDYIVAYLGHDKLPDSIYGAQRVKLLEDRGVKVYPDFNSLYYFDDKAIETDLLKIHEIPTPDTRLILSREEGRRLSRKLVPYPLVIKLRKGASGKSVKLVKQKRDFQRLIDNAFSRRGVSLSSGYYEMAKGYSMFRNGTLGKYGLLKLVVKYFTFYERLLPMNRDKSCLIVQEFIKDQDHDFRIIVVYDRCYAYKRYSNSNDFKASGTGKNDYDISSIPIPLIVSAFDYANRLNMKVCAFDFIEKSGEYLCLEFSVFFGYWPNMQNSYFDRHGEIVVAQDNLADYLLQKHLDLI